MTRRSTTSHPKNRLSRLQRQSSRLRDVHLWDLTGTMPFSRLELSHAMVEGVKAMGYIEPTPIQLRAIPLILSGRDVIGSAQTGTGKTAAFALPILSKLGQHSPGKSPRVLILEPTRELAAQVETAFRDYARFTDLNITESGFDHLEQGTLRLDKIEFLVLDEADR